MYINFYDEKILDYELINDSNRNKLPYEYSLMYEEKTYSFIWVKYVADGFMIDNVFCEETEAEVIYYKKLIYFNDTDIFIKVKNIDKDVRLTFSFKEGYKVRFIVENINKVSTSYYMPDEYVSFKILKSYFKRTVKDVTVKSKNVFEYNVLDYYGYIHGEYQVLDKNYNFLMPKQNVDIILTFCEKEKKKSVVSIKFDLGSIKKYIYSINRYKYDYDLDINYYKCNLTKALDKEDEEFGNFNNEQIDENIEYTFNKRGPNKNLYHITLYLLEKVNLKVLFNGKEVDANINIIDMNVSTKILNPLYEYYIRDGKISNENWDKILEYRIDDDSKFSDDDYTYYNEKIYEYDINYLKLFGSGTISFKIADVASDE